MRDDRTGIYGAFAVRAPVGKTLGITVALVLLPLCVWATRWTLGTVGWTEKGVMLRAAWDGFANPIVQSLSFGKSRGNDWYRVLVQVEHSNRLYRDVDMKAGRKGRWTWVQVQPAVMSELLDRVVYGGRLAWRLAPVWLAWPILAMVALFGGKQVDMSRLRRGRHQGVWLRGNRLVDRGEWNRRAREEV